MKEIRLGKVAPAILSQLNQKSCSCSVCKLINYKIRAGIEPSNTPLSVEEKPMYFYNLSQNFNIARSQKAIGINVMCNNSMYPFGVPQEAYLIQSDEDIEIFKVGYSETKLASKMPFARPCPITPRHGFVDSRRIGSFESLDSIWKEARLADEQAELIIMPYIKSYFNAVITPSVIAIGRGHDGATNGNDAISLPVQGELLTKKVKELAGIIDTEYLEVVYGEYHRATLTQYRNGPALIRAKDYIPKDFIVSQVVEVAGQDLLQWEQLINELLNKATTAVYHKGGVLGSHYGVHCRLNEVAYITSFKPEIGQRLKEVKETNFINYPLVQRGIAYGLSEDMDGIVSQAIATKDISEFGIRAMSGVLYTLHNYNLLGSDQSFLLGVSIANMIRLCTSAALGELRHFSGLKNTLGRKLPGSREEVYNKYLVDVRSGMSKLKIAREVFLKGGWSGSYGGKAWGNCTVATIELINKAIQFERKQNKRWLKELIDAYNKVINQVHNGGKFLNKFIDNSKFDIAAKSSAKFAGLQAPQLYELVKSLEEKEKDNRRAKNFKLIKPRTTKQEDVKLQIMFENQNKPNYACYSCGEKFYKGDCDKYKHCDDCCDCDSGCGSCGNRLNNCSCR